MPQVEEKKSQVMTRQESAGVGCWWLMGWEFHDTNIQYFIDQLKLLYQFSASLPVR